MDRAERWGRESDSRQEQRRGESHERSNRAREQEARQLLGTRELRRTSEIKNLRGDQLQAYVEREADALARVIEGGKTRDTTLCVTILQKRGEGAESRRVLLTSSAEAYESKVHIKGGNLKEIGPYLRPRKAENGENGRKETKRTLYSVDRLDGVQEEYDPSIRKEHHAEQRAKKYADDNGYEILAMAPTRGCCDSCRKELGAELAKVPEHRRSQAEFRRYMRGRQSG